MFFFSFADFYFWRFRFIYRDKTNKQKKPDERNSRRLDATFLKEPSAVSVVCRSTQPI